MKYSIGCICAVLLQDSVFGMDLIQSFVAPQEKQDASSIGDLGEKSHSYSSSHSLTKDTPVYKRLLRALKFRDDEEARLTPVEVEKEDRHPRVTVEKTESKQESSMAVSVDPVNSNGSTDTITTNGSVDVDCGHLCSDEIATRHLESIVEDCASFCTNRPVITQDGEDFSLLISDCVVNRNSYCPEYLNYPAVTIGCWDVSAVTNMTGAFRYAYYFDEPISCWNVTSVTDMDYMFYEAPDFNQYINDWNVARVTNMKRTFSEAYSFTQSLNDWNVARVTDMSYMFKGAESFNQPLNAWNVAKVKTMEGMLYYGYDFNQPIDAWNVARVETMEKMFYYALNFTQPLDDWNVAKVTTMESMFEFAIKFDQTLNNWNVLSLNSTDWMFGGASDFNQCLSTWAAKTSPDLSRYSMFSGSSCENYGPWCCEGKYSCVNTEYKMIPNEVQGLEMWCGGLLNQLFAPPQETEKLKAACNRRIKSTDPSASDGMVLVSEECPTFCNFDNCCPVDEQFQFLMDDGRVKRCGGLLNVLVADKTVEGKGALAEACAAEYEAVSGGTAVVEDICTGLCRKGCEVIECVNKTPDQFLLIPDDEDSDNMLSCDEFLKDMSLVERKIVCKEKIHIFNVKKNKTLKKQTPKKTCPLYCGNRCKKQLALSNESSQPSKKPSDIMLESREPSDIMLESREPSDIMLESGEPSDIMLESGEPSDIKLESGEPSEGPIEGLSLTVAPSAKPFETPSKEPDMIPSAGPSKAPELAYLMAQISTTTTDDANELAVEINNEAMNGDCKISTTAVLIPCEAYLLCGKTQTNETCFAVETIVQAPVGGGGCDVNLGVEFLGDAFRNPPNPNVTCFADIVLMLATEYPSSQPSIVQSSSPTLLASN